MQYGVCICLLFVFVPAPLKTHLSAASIIAHLVVCAIIVYGLFRLHLDVDVDACRHFQSLKSIDCLLSRSDDVDQSLVSSLLELLTAVSRMRPRACDHMPSG